MVKLLSVATLWSLEKITKNLDIPEYVTFVWRKLENQKDQWVLKVEIQNYAEWINLIVKYLKMLEITVQKKYEKKRKILASEVNDKAIKNTDANQILKQVADAEHAVELQVSSKSVKNLMNSYQKAIEYYSALDNKCFEDFLSRMTNMFHRDDIQKALAQPEEEEEKKEVTGETNNNDTSQNLNETQGSNSSQENLNQEVFQFKDGDLGSS